MVAKGIKSPLAHKATKSTGVRTKLSLKDVSTDTAITSKPSVQATLDQRGSIYGSFRDNSRAAISLLNVINEFNGLRTVPLPDYELNALIMIAEKMSRVLTGKSHEDNWIDMAGYSELGRNPR